MSASARSGDAQEPDLIDRIANALPVDVRSEYYRELRHCRSLPENDEMLRILRAMQFLTLLIHRAPERLAAEREHLSNLLEQCTVALEHTVQRLVHLPEEVAAGISPERIAAAINESLRQQFLRSTIPETGEALQVVSTQLKRSVVDFQQAAIAISNAHRSASVEAARAVREIEGAISAATDSTRRAAEALSNTFLHEYRWSVAMLVSAALALGFLAGLFVLERPYLPVETPTEQGAPAPKPNTRR